MKHRLFILDAPNIDMALTSRLGHRPAQAERPDFVALRQWLEQGLPPTMRLRACIFVNAPLEKERRAGLQGWVAYMVRIGYFVFVKPQNGEDIDSEMLREINWLERESTLGELIVASHDAKCFLPVMKSLAAKSISVTAIGFREDAGQLGYELSIRYIDFADLPNVLPESTPTSRVDLDWLPDTGRWYAPSSSSR